MKIFSTNLTLIVIGLGIVLSGKLAVAQVQEPPAGQYKCVSYAAPTLDHGLCRYQVKNGDGVWNKLLGIASSLITGWDPANGGFDPNDHPPHIGMGVRTIEWWYTEPGHNDMIGNILVDNDRQQSFPGVMSVHIDLKIHTFETGYERDLGYDVGAFYGNRQAGTTTTVANANYNSGLGIFRSAVALMSPLADYLTMGIRASYDRKRGEELTSYERDCPVDSDCSYGTPSNNYFISNIDTKVDVKGLSIGTTPEIDPINPTRVLLKNLDISWGVETGKDKSPVEKMMIRQYQDLELRSGETVVLGTITTTKNLKTGGLLEAQAEKHFTQVLATIKVTVNGSSLPKPGEKTLEELSKAYYEKLDKDLAAPHVKPESLSDFFKSIERVCFDDEINGHTSQKICGFEFSKMDKEIAKYHLRFSLKGKLKYAERSDDIKLGLQAFKDYGYYHMPMLDDTGTSGDYVVTVEIDNPDRKTLEKIKSEGGVRGVQFSFRNYPTLNEPVEFSEDSIKLLK